MATIHQRALLALEKASLPTGTIGPEHADLPGLVGHEGEAVVVRLLDLDPADAERLAARLRATIAGAR